MRTLHALLAVVQLALLATLPLSGQASPTPADAPADCELHALAAPGVGPVPEPPARARLPRDERLLLSHVISPQIADGRLADAIPPTAVRADARQRWQLGRATTSSVP